MFDLTQVEVKDSYSLIPRGSYPAVVDKAEWKKTKKGDDYLNIQWKILGDNFGGRVLFQMLNLGNSNEKAKEIAFQDLASMLMASGMKKSDLKFNDNHQVTAAVLGARVNIYIMVESNEGYEDQNVVKGFNPLKLEEEKKKTITNADVPF